MWMSMTSYGAGEANSDEVKISVEIKTVNHRHLDVVLRFPRDYMGIEHQAGAEIKQVFARGRVEAFARRVDLTGTGGIHLDWELAAQYQKVFQALKHRTGVSGNVDLALLLAQPGVMGSAEVARDADADWPVLQRALQAALSAAQQMRRLEGEALRQDIVGRIRALIRMREEVLHLASTERELQLTRLRDRVKALLEREKGGEIDEGRLLQEVAILVERNDITEELTRLASHFHQVLELQNEQQAVGRKLDFLVQEVMREVNTMSAKVSQVEIKRISVEMKTEVEKIREQVQNIE